MKVELINERELNSMKPIKMAVLDFNTQVGASIDRIVNKDLREMSPMFTNFAHLNIYVPSKAGDFIKLIGMSSKNRKIRSLTLEVLVMFETSLKLDLKHN